MALHDLGAPMPTGPGPNGTYPGFVCMTCYEDNDHDIRRANPAELRCMNPDHDWPAANSNTCGYYWHVACYEKSNDPTVRYRRGETHYATP